MKPVKNNYIQIIGVYGRVGVGKTTLLKKLEPRVQNCEFIYGDELVTELYKVGNKGYKAILKNLGGNFVEPTHVSKTILIENILNTNITIEQLNDIMFPILFNELKKLIIKSQKHTVIVEIPLLNQYWDYFAKLFNGFILIKVEPKIYETLIAEKTKHYNLFSKKIFEFVNDFDDKELFHIHQHLKEYQYNLENKDIINQKIINDFKLHEKFS